MYVCNTYHICVYILPIVYCLLIDYCLPLMYIFPAIVDMGPAGTKDPGPGIKEPKEGSPKLLRNRWG